MSANNKKQKQSIIIRGIAASIQAMHMPTFQNLKDILAKFGWNITRDLKTNKQESQSE